MSLLPLSQFQIHYGPLVVVVWGRKRERESFGTGAKKTTSKPNGTQTNNITMAIRGCTLLLGVSLSTGSYEIVAHCCTL